MKYLLTGGSGFLGRAFLKAAEKYPLTFAEDQYTVYARDEQKLDACRQKFPQHRYVLGDIRDTSKLHDVAIGHDAVIHTAALKYVPQSESNVFEFVDVNILGTLSVIEAVKNTNVKTVVGISTDKAALPVNTYGMTKAVMERLFMEANVWNPYCDFYLTRYGNVIGSTGSVIPQFQRQLETLGHIELTDPKMTRFWLDVEEAVALVDECFDLKDKGYPSGTTIVPRPKAAFMGEVAKAVVGDDESLIKIVGARIGEKQHEELIHYQESKRTVVGDKRYYLLPPGQEPKDSVEPFTVASHSPSHWMDAAEISRIMAASVLI